MPLNLEEILALPDIGQKINYLKKGRKTELPDRCKLWDDWNSERHEIMVDKEKYPDRKVLEKEAEKHFDEKTGKTYEIEAKYKTEPVNRISIPLEQDIVNIQTAFTVGTEPSMDALRLMMMKRSCWMRSKLYSSPTKSNIRTRRLSVPGFPNKKRQNIGMLPMMIRFGRSSGRKLRLPSGGR